MPLHFGYLGARTFKDSREELKNAKIIRFRIYFREPRSSSEEVSRVFQQPKKKQISSFKEPLKQVPALRRVLSEFAQGFANGCAG